MSNLSYARMLLSVHIPNNCFVNGIPSHDDSVGGLVGGLFGVQFSIPRA